MQAQADVQSSFGIREIVDCKLDKDGKQLYKVKWEPTWEPAENLVSCKHLIDKFWSFINHAKNNEAKAERFGKRPRLDMVSPSMNINQYHLSEDSKADVQKLIARTNATQVGNGPPLVSPSNALNQQNINQAQPSFHLQQQQQMGNNNQKNIFNPQQQNFSPQQQQRPKVVNKPSSSIKMDGGDDSIKSSGSNNIIDPGKTAVSNYALKYIENFSNPYVKILLVCKICNKEMSLKFSSNWKKHYLTHASNSEKPHQCSICSKGFVTATALTKHINSKHAAATSKTESKFQIPNFNL